jgi:AcrR family transcriptional regulator
VSAEETIQKIVDATVECLVQSGYSQTTIAHIAAAAGVSRGALTHHFATKEELILEVLNGIFRDKAQRFLDALPKEPSLGMVDEAIDQAFRAYTDERVFIVYLDLWTQARWNDKLREVIQAHFRELRTLLARIVDRDFAALGPITDGDTIALLLLVVVEGVALQYLTDPETVNAHRLLQMMKAAARLLFAGQPRARPVRP